MNGSEPRIQHNSYAKYLPAILKRDQQWADQYLEWERCGLQSRLSGQDDELGVRPIASHQMPVG